MSDDQLNGITASIDESPTLNLHEKTGDRIVLEADNILSGNSIDSLKALVKSNSDAVSSFIVTEPTSKNLFLKLIPPSDEYLMSNYKDDKVLPRYNKYGKNFEQFLSQLYKILIQFKQFKHNFIFVSIDKLLYNI